MTISELLEQHPGTAAEDWHRHPNGGGWVYKTVSVDNTAYIGENARVYGKARVYDKAKVCGRAQVYDELLVKIYPGG